MRPPDFIKLLAVAVVGCASPEGVSFGGMPARLYLTEGGGPPQQLVEYGAVPLSRLRAFPLQAAGIQVAPVLIDWTNGGFYAVREGIAYAGSVVPPAAWSLVRYDSAWSVAAVRPGTDFPPDSGAYARLALTPDNKWLVAQRGDSLAVLDASTLAIHGYLPARGGYIGFTTPNGGGPTQVLLTHGPTDSGGCPWYEWVDAPTLVVGDSAAVPCAQEFLGAITTRRLILEPWSGGRLTLYDPLTQATLATQDGPLARITSVVMDTASQVLIATAAGDSVLFLDPATLHVRDVWVGSSPLANRVVLGGVLDPRRGALFADEATSTQSGYLNQVTLVFDVRRAALAGSGVLAVGDFFLR